MTPHQFKIKYRISPVMISKFISNGIFKRGRHFNIEYDLHQRKIDIIDPGTVYDLILKNSKTIRKRKNVATN